MLKTGYGRLLAALFAAVGLHALLLVLIPPASLPLSAPASGGLVVELLPEKALTSVQTPQAYPAEMPVRPHNQPPKVDTLASAQSSASQSAMSAAASQTVRPQPADKTSQQSSPAPQVDTAVVYEPAASRKPPSARGDAGGNITAASLPDSARRRILAYVHYPRQARRFGWQGSAKFRLRVAEQGIHDIVLLASTGHVLLDTAARRGIEQVGRVLLADGNYLLPVEFRLQ